VKAGAYATWADLFNAKANNLSNPEVPVLCAWRNLDAGTGSVMRFERNPYYWKVDTAGNQLPYIDALQVSFYADVDTCLLKALAGECDFQYREIASLANYPVLTANAAKGGYRIIPTATLNANMYTIFLNRATADPVKSRLFIDLRFRQALSLAIDRRQINDRLLGGMCEVVQVSPPAGAASYDEATARMFTEYDISRANSLLDDMGLPWDAKKEWRLGSDGRPLTFTKIFFTGWPPYQAEAQDLAKEGWSRIGISVNNRALERSQWLSAIQGVDWDMSAYAADAGGGAYSPLPTSGLFPQTENWYAGPQWGRWYASGGLSGLEPPPEVKKLRALYEEYISTATMQRMLDIEKEAARIYVGNLLAIGILSRPRMEVYYVASMKMRNIPPKLLDDVTVHVPAQFCFE